MLDQPSFNFKIISEVGHVIICLVAIFFCFQCVQVEDLNIFSIIVPFLLTFVDLYNTLLAYFDSCKHSYTLLQILEMKFRL